MAIEGHGYPAQTRRYHLTDEGARLRDERLVADPRSEVSAEVFELLLWQVGALGLLAPVAVMLYEPAGWAANARVRWAGLAWEVESVLQDQAAPAWATITENAAGDVSVLFAATATAGDGTTQAISMIAGFAQPAGLDGSDAPENIFATAERVSARELRVRTRNGTTGSLTSSPFVLIIFGGG
jgi:hypothetical protein